MQSNHSGLQCSCDSTWTAPYSVYGQYGDQREFPSESCYNLATNVTYNRRNERSAWNLHGNAEDRELEVRNFYSPFGWTVPFKTKRLPGDGGDAVPADYESWNQTITP